MNEGRLTFPFSVDTAPRWKVSSEGLEFLAEPPCGKSAGGRRVGMEGDLE